MCMIAVALSFKIIVDEKKNLYNFESYILKENTAGKYKEYNLTYLTEYIISNVSPLEKTEICNYFNEYGEKNIYSFEHSYIKYNKQKDCFSLMYYYGDNVIKEDDYKYDVVNSNIKYTYFYSTYINGRI